MYGPGNSYAGIHANGGYGDIMDNVIVDADGHPDVRGHAACWYHQPVGRFPTATTATATLHLQLRRQRLALVIDIETDSWGYEISLEITKPDGTKDSWSTYTFSSNTAYKPLTTYTDAGTYTIDVSDSWGDGGITLDAYYTSAQSGVPAPSSAATTFR